MSIMDIFRLSEIKAELARSIEERDSLKSALADIDKMEYSQLRRAIENLKLQTEKANQELQALQVELAKRRQGSDQQLLELGKQIELRKKEIIVLDQYLRQLRFRRRLRKRVNGA